MNFKNTTYEPCLYQATYKNHKVLVMIQVEDFAIASTNKEICQEIISHIDKAMTIKIKDLGLIQRYNGSDVIQTREYIKIHSETYIEKICKGHGWDLLDKKMHAFPLPMNPDRTYLARLDESVKLDEDPKNVEKRKGFSYRQAIGELIYAMVTTRPDISFPVIKLAQFSINPAEIHYDAVKDVFLYLYSTKTEGIYYWRKKPLNLPNETRPRIREYNYTPKILIKHDGTTLVAYSDSDWTGDLVYRRSITGVAIMYAGGVVCYKTKYQETIALSSTEAEFVALCDAGKNGSVCKVNLG